MSKGASTADEAVAEAATAAPEDEDEVASTTAETAAEVAHGGRGQGCVHSGRGRGQFASMEAKDVAEVATTAKRGPG